MTNQLLFAGGPAYQSWNSITWKMVDDWKVTNPDQFTDVKSATGVGETKLIADKMGKINFTPKIFKSTLAAQLAAIAPYNSNLNGGKLLRPTSDLPAVIHMRNGGASNLGLTFTAYAAWLTKMAKFSFAPSKPLCGSIELTYLQALGTNVGDASSLSDTASSTYAEPGWSMSDELFDRYTLGLGVTALTAGATTSTSPTLAVASTAGVLLGQGVSGTGIPANTTVLAIVDSTHLTLSANATATGSALTITLTQLPIVTDKDGIDFTPDCKIDMQKPSQEPTRDGKQDMITGVLEFTPHNIDVDAWYATYFPEEGQALGQSYEQLGTQANVTGAKSGGCNLLLPQVTRFKSGHQFSRVKPRMDKVQLQAVDFYNGTAWQPLFTFGVND